MNWSYDETFHHIILDKPPKSRLKVTGTRFATILGLNAWQTDFSAWCEITKAARIPFEETIYTQAGKAIEPIAIEYFKRNNFAGVVTPQEYFGNEYSSLKYDFFPKEKIFGGMWDALIIGGNGKPRGILEIKTTKRAEDWVNGVPVYYLLQGALYAYLVGVDNIFFQVSFLEDEDYRHPENFICTNENTKNYVYNLSQIIVNVNGVDYSFNELVDVAKYWYNTHIENGVSPVFDETRDKDYLKILRTAHPENDNSIDSIIETLAFKQQEYSLKYMQNGLDILNKEIDALKASVKEYLVSKMDGGDRIEYRNWVVSKGKPKVEANVEKLIADNLTEYLKEKEGTLTLRQIKEDI